MVLPEIAARIARWAGSEAGRRGPRQAAGLVLALALGIGPGCLVAFDESLIADRGASGDSAAPSRELSTPGDASRADAGPAAEQPPFSLDGPPAVPDGSPAGPDAPPPDASPPPDAPCVPSTTQLTFPAHADAWVDESLPTTNFGQDPELFVDMLPEQHAYLRFRVLGVTGVVQAVTLELQVTNGSTDGPAIHPAANGWPETGITWDTRPGPSGPALADLGAVAIGPLQVALPGALTGDGTYSFVLLPTSADGMDFVSREGAPAPQLVVSVSQGCAD